MRTCENCSLRNNDICLYDSDAITSRDACCEFWVERKVCEVTLYKRLVPEVVYKRYTIRYRFEAATRNLVAFMNNRFPDTLAVVKF